MCFPTGHGLPVTALAIRVDDAQTALARALDLGAEPTDSDMIPPGLHVPALQGVGAVPLYLVDDATSLAPLYGDVEFAARAGHDMTDRGTVAIDHLAYGVYGGRLSYWASLYASLFGNRVLRCLDLEVAGAEGIRHIALRTGVTDAALDALRAAGVPLIASSPDGTHPEDTSCLCLRMAAGCVAVEFIGLAPGPSDERPVACAFA
jgi:4-hydroxyphenylpyruvate dioxygenase-like putative hemolysin